MNDTLDFKLTIEEINIVLQGLGELPSKLSMNLINSIQNQAAPQMQPQSIEEEKEEEV
tara:strand:- start:266 stop:439 length:174 start_codon:yes stop_codon:yes gene_type:complete